MFFTSCINPLTSIDKKKTVAITGLLLVLFIIAHLAGNLLIFAGPKALNAYAHVLHSLGIGLWFLRIALLIIFLIHIYFTYLLVVDNIKARGGLKRYAVDKMNGERSIVTRLMPISGFYIFLFVILHILDFAAVNPDGPRSVINGVSYGIYGLVFNSFTDPVHGILYIIAIFFLGLHLMHGVESYYQTQGIHPTQGTRGIVKFSRYFTLIMIVGYSSIPVYVYLKARALC